MRKKIALGGLMMVATMVLAEPAMAQELSSSGVMNDVLKRFHDAAATWGPAIESAASRLFWTLVVISMVWTFGMMALRKADIGEFFAEFVRFTIFTGFFWWLLTNANQGMNIAGTIVQSLQTLGAQAGGLSNSNLGPSSILDLGFELYNRTVQATSELGWRQMATALVMELMALAVLFVLALIAVNLLLLLASAWILLYAGVFFLGFGGSRWTSDMAINYYKTVLGLAAQLMAMVLLVAIGKEFINHYYTQISENMASQELAVMLVISVILLFLVNKVPPMISGLVSGGGIGAAGGIGNFGAGAAVGAAVTAASMAMTDGKLHADDTPVQVLLPGNKKTKTGRLWAYVRDDRNAGSALAPAVWFAYSPDRKGIHPQTHLACFSGVLQADAYAGFNELYRNGGITEAACWAHARRKIHDVHVRIPSALTEEALEQIGQLYAIEADIRGMPAEQRLAERQRKTKPLLKSLESWLREKMNRDVQTE